MQYRSTWCKAVAHDFGIFWDSRSIHIQHRAFQDTKHKKRPDFGILFVASILISNLKPVSMNFAAVQSAKSATHWKFGETGGLPTAPFCRAVRNILDRASCRDLRQQKGERCAAVPHLRRAALASFKAHHSGHDNDIKSSKDRWVKGQSVLEWYGVINLASLARCNHLRPLLRMFSIEAWKRSSFSQIQLTNGARPNPHCNSTFDERYTIYIPTIGIGWVIYIYYL